MDVIFKFLSGKMLVTTLPVDFIKPGFFQYISGHACPTELVGSVSPNLVVVGSR